MTTSLLLLLYRDGMLYVVCDWLFFALLCVRDDCRCIIVARRPQQPNIHHLNYYSATKLYVLN